MKGVLAVEGSRRLFVLQGVREERRLRGEEAKRGAGVWRAEGSRGKRMARRRRESIRAHRHRQKLEP